jgi:hypothetical protein
MMMMMMMVLSILQQQKHDYGDDPSQMQMSETRGKKKHTHPSIVSSYLGFEISVCLCGVLGFSRFSGRGLTSSPPPQQQQQHYYVCTTSAAAAAAHLPTTDNTFFYRICDHGVA